jgi:hypothetical protein
MIFGLGFGFYFIFYFLPSILFFGLEEDLN